MNVRDPADDPPKDRGAGRSYRSATIDGFRNDRVSDPVDRDDAPRGAELRPNDDPPVDGRRGRSEYPPRSDEEAPRPEVFVLLYIII